MQRVGERRSRIIPAHGSLHRFLEGSSEYFVVESRIQAAEYSEISFGRNYVHLNEYVSTKVYQQWLYIKPLLLCIDNS